MTRMSPPGKTEGYILLDAVMAMLMAVLFAAVIVAGLGVAMRSSTATLTAAEDAIHSRNEWVEMRLHAD